MNRITYVFCIASCLFSSISLFSQTIQSLNTKPSNISQNASARKLSADDVAEIKTTNQGFTNDSDQKAGVFADPLSSRTMACATAFNLVCPYNTNNGQRGCMFDVLATNTVTISCFDANLYSGTTANYEIWYRPSTHVGFQNSSAGWTLLGSATGITSAGNNLPTALPIPVGVTIPAGQRYAFYITNDFGGGTSYTDGTAVGNFLAGDANITAFEGVGKSYSFGLTFTVRNFNGTIYYDLGGVFDADEAFVKANAEGNSVKIDWETPANQSFQKVELEYAENGGQFGVIESLDQNLRSGSLNVIPKGKENWFRLRMTSPNGEVGFSNIAKISIEDLEPFKLLSLFPNPSAGDMQLHFLNHVEDPINVQVTDALGRIVFNENYGEGESHVALPMKEMESGIYLLSLSSKGKRETRRIIHQ